MPTSACDPLRPRQRRQQHDPPAHARSDQDLRPCGQRIDDRDRVIAPSGRSCLGEIAARRAVPEIVEAHIGAPAPAAIIFQKQSLGAGHVGAEAAEEDDAGVGAGERAGRRLSPRPGVLDVSGWQIAVRTGIRFPAEAHMSDNNIAPRRQKAAAACVLQVIPSLVSGGVERGTVDLARALADAGWTAIVASAGGPMERELARAGATHVTLPLASKNPLVIRRNAARARRGDPRSTGSTSSTPAAAPRRGAPGRRRSATRRHFVTTFHNAYDAGVPLKHRYNSVMARGERVIAISQFVAEHVAPESTASARPAAHDPARRRSRHSSTRSRVGGDRVVALATQWRVPDGDAVVMLPGRLTRWKGGLDFIDAIARLGRPRHAAACSSAPSSARASARSSKRRSSGAGSSGQFRIVEDCRDMPAAYVLADVVVSASTDPEGFGRIIVEAQAMGRPVVATDHGGARETIVPGLDRLARAAARPAALAAAIGEALDLTAAERDALGRRAVAHVAADSPATRCAPARSMSTRSCCSPPRARPQCGKGSRWRSRRECTKSTLLRIKGRPDEP